MPLLHRTPEEQRWLSALENARFGVWDLDPREELVHYSPAWKARLGFPRVLAADAAAFWRCRVHPEDLSGMLGSLRAHLEGDNDSYAMRFRLRSNGSGYRTMLSHGRVVARDAAGTATRMVGTMVDLTARPVVPATHGLASDDAGALQAPHRLPLHALLATPAVPGAQRQAMLDGISDLLDIALRQSAGAT
jgi:PAS fold